MATKQELLKSVREYLEEQELPTKVALEEIEKFVKDVKGNKIAFGFFNPSQPALEIETDKLDLYVDRAKEYFLGNRDYYCLQSKKALSLYNEEKGKEVILIWKL